MHTQLSADVLETAEGKPAVLIKGQGKLSCEVERYLRQHFDKTLVRVRAGGVILDLSEVEGIDTACVARTCDFNDKLRHDNINLVIVNSPVVQLEFERVGFGERFAFVPDVETAMSTLGVVG